MIKMYEGQKHSTNEIRTYLGLSRNIYKIIGNERKIKKMDIDILEQIARLEGLQPEELRGKMLEYAKKN